jgi:putative DNA primase/helicase
MSEARKKAEQLWDQEGKKQQREQAPDHVELRDRWLELNPNMAFGNGEWMSYADGYWKPVEDVAVEGQVMDILEAAIPEGMKPTQSILSSVTRLARAKTYVPKQRWRANENVMVLANGTLEVLTRTFREHRMKDYALHALPYEYDPDADCPIFKAILEQIGEEFIEMFQDYAGYCLTHDTSH